MNPFQLSGPGFLLFFVVLVVAIVSALVVWRRRMGPAPGDMRQRLSDPLHIAAVRGGATEVTRVATANLLHLGWLRAEGDFLHPATPPQPARPPTDGVSASIMQAAASQLSIRQLLIHDAVKAESDAVVSELSREGWTISSAQRTLYLFSFKVAAVGLLILTCIRCVTGITHGHPIDLLIFAQFAAFIALFLAYVLTAHSPATRAGRAALAHLALLFKPLQQRNRTSDSLKPSSQEMLLLIAVFGGSSAAMSAQELWAGRNSPSNEISITSSDSSSSDGDGGSSGDSSCGGGGGCGGGGCGG